MRLISVFALLTACFVCSSDGFGSKLAAEQLDIGRSGKDFLELCSSADREQTGDPVRVHNGTLCLGWVEGFRDGFTVHDELLGVPQKDRMVCIPSEITNVQVIRVIKKYVADNPDKAHRATRLVASLALAGTFRCKARK